LHYGCLDKETFPGIDEHYDKTTGKLVGMLDEFRPRLIVSSKEKEERV